MATNNFKPLQAQSFLLSGAGAVTGATSITLSSFTQIDGTLIAMSDLGTKAFVTLEPGNGTLEEQISFTGVTQNANGTATLTGVSSVLFAYPYTETSGLSKTHAGSTTIVLSNTSGFYNQIVSKNDDATVTGQYTFDVSTGRPKLSSDVDTAINEELVDFGQLSRTSFAGTVNASTTVKGIVELATQAEVDAKTTTGGTGALLVPTPERQRSTLLSDYVVDTGSANAYAIAPSPAISAYTTGQRFTFKSTNTNTLTSTLNVNTVGTKTIQRNGSNLGAGDIISGQIYEVEYDGTNFQLLTPVNSTPSGVIQMYAAASAPTGWLLCDGTSYLRATYPVLFAVIGSTFGSADGTHFNVPDMRGRIAIGTGTGTGGGASGTGLPTGGSALTAVSLAGWKGEETHTLITAEMPSHTHTVTAPLGGSGSPGWTSASTGGSAITSSSAGSDGAHNNIQPVLGLSYIIKT